MDINLLCLMTNFEDMMEAIGPLFSKVNLCTHTHTHLSANSPKDQTDPHNSLPLSSHSLP